MKILVIGSEGFIGRHLMEQGRAMGHEMVGCDIVGNPDLRGLSTWVPKEKRNYDRVIHSAGRLGTEETLNKPQRTIESNISNVVNALEDFRLEGIPFTYLTLGNNWLNPYSITKNCAAEFVRMFHHVHGLPTQVAVCYNVFGPYQKWKPVRKIVPEFMTRILRGQELQLFFKGEQEVDMVFAPDLARAILGNQSTGNQHYGSAIPRKVINVARDCVHVLKENYPTRMDFTGNKPGETGPAAIAPYAFQNQTPYMEALGITADWYRKAIQEEPV